MGTIPCRLTPWFMVKPGLVMALASFAERRRAAWGMGYSVLASSIHVLIPYTKTCTIKTRMHAEADEGGNCRKALKSKG